MKDYPDGGVYILKIKFEKEKISRSEGKQAVEELIDNRNLAAEFNNFKE